MEFEENLDDDELETVAHRVEYLLGVEFDFRPK